jgi:hypothetical protein
MRPLDAAVLGQDPEKPAPKSLADIAREQAKKRTGKPVKTVKIENTAAQKPGERPHGSPHPLVKDDGSDTVQVWDAMRGQWTPRGKLSALKAR